MSHFRVILPFQGQFRTVLSIAGSQSIGLSDDWLSSLFQSKVWVMRFQIWQYSWPIRACQRNIASFSREKGKDSSGVEIDNRFGLLELHILSRRNRSKWIEVTNIVFIMVKIKKAISQRLLFSMKSEHLTSLTDWASLQYKKIQTLIDQQRTNLADVEYLDLDYLAI